jgi:hypothetical protein
MFQVPEEPSHPLPKQERIKNILSAEDPQHSLCFCGIPEDILLNASLDPCPRFLR